MTSIRRGDVLVVGRLLTWRAWLRDPLSASTSWGIQRVSRTPWNHVACYIGRGMLVEAQMIGGVRFRRLSHYTAGAYRLCVARPPLAVDRRLAVEFWRELPRRTADLRRYDWQTILVMRLAAALKGGEAISKVIRNHDSDNRWICSEVGASGWKSGGMESAPYWYVTPDDFADEQTAKATGATVIAVEDPRQLQIED